MQQIPVALGTAEETGLAEVVQGNAAFSVTAIAVAAGGLLVLWLWGSPLIRRVKSLRWIPGPLIARLLGCVTTLLLTHFAPQQLAALPRITLPAFGSLGDLLGELESPGVERVAQSVGVGGGGNPGAGRQPRNPAQPGGAEKAAPAKSATFTEPRNGRPGRRQSALRRAGGDADHRGDRPQLGERQQRRAEQTVDFYPRRTAADLRPVV